ncbi:uncharacterized protein LOC104583502 [Brachypodium distachyon]|uniref:uncharacterized protein LOC104583502 n=1 Tax=Brachypodium distachyon TaxID=15368 RepID=UPI00052FDF66|nr:uncharacterized protein LOC104583502 [Brachypodium distachyon]|eukprot:XP_010234148.1 uncharacterized protein LOC104583502 [Brachypodium distachyon]
MDPGEGSSTGVRKESATQYNMDWPSDCFFEEPRPVHVDWPMNNQFDLNMNWPMDSQVDLHRDCNFEGSERQPIDLNEDMGCDKYFRDDSGFGNFNVSGHVELEPEPFPASDHGEDEVSCDGHEVSKAAMRRAARRAESKANATKARELKKRIAAGTKEDALVISDSCSDELKGLTDSSDDDGVELLSSRCVLQKKSKAKPLKN